MYTSNGTWMFFLTLGVKYVRLGPHLTVHNYNVCLLISFTPPKKIVHLGSLPRVISHSIIFDLKGLSSKERIISTHLEESLHHSGSGTMCYSLYLT